MLNLSKNEILFTFLVRTKGIDSCVYFPSNDYEL